MKKMSKILSVILAISMVISMIPMSFAAEGDTGDGYKIVYDFVDSYSDSFYAARKALYEEKKEAGANVSESEFAVQTLLRYKPEYTYGFWSLYEGPNSFPSFNHYLNATNTGVRVYFTSTRNWYSMKIKVPAEGDYTLTLKHDKAGSFEKSLDVYLLDGTTTKEEIEAKLASETDNVGFVGTVNSNGDAKGVVTPISTAPVSLENKEYVVVFHAKSEDDKNDIRIQNLTLTSGDGSKTLPMSVDASASKNTLDATTAGDNAQISVSSVIYSDTAKKTEDILATDFVYTSSDTSLATVDANGKVTVAPTAVPGKVDISVAAKENPGFVIKTVSFDIVASKTTNTKIVYDFIDNYTEDVPYKDKVDKNGNATIENAFYAGSGATNQVDTYLKSNGFWKFYLQENSFSVNHQWNSDGTKPWNQGLYAYFGADKKEPNKSWFAIKIRVPVSDIYDASIGAMSNSAYETELETFILDGNSDAAAISESISSGKGKLGTVDCTEGGYQGLDNERRKLSTVNLKAGEYLVVFHSVNDIKAKIWSFVLTAGNGTNIIPMSAEISANDVEAGKSTAITLTKAHMSDATAATSASGVTYESSDSNILAVSGTNATGVKAGTAKIYAKYNGEIIGETEVTVTNATVGKTVNVAIDDDGDGKATVKSATLGADVIAEAKDRSSEGLVFRGWVRGSADNGRLVSTENPYTFKAMTNIYLTAIYTDVLTSETTEYYNWNGQFLGTTEPTGAKVPTLLGYVFKAWKDAGKVGSISRKIAEFDKKDESFAITDDASFNMTSADSKYDTEVTCTADSNVYWYRDNKLVDYGTSYTFFIWGATKVTTSNEGHDGAKIILDKEKDGSWMIEYDAGIVDKANILEVGIVFGDTGSTPTVEVCEEKMSSQRDDFTHGQFAATSDYPVARGYLVYNDNGEYKVIYAD